MRAKNAYSKKVPRNIIEITTCFSNEAKPTKHSPITMEKKNYHHQPIHRIISTGIMSPDYLDDRKVGPMNYLGGARWLPRIILTSDDDDKYSSL